MSPSGSDVPTKAVIINHDFPSEQVECLFNPKEYGFDKSNKWEQKKTSGKNLPQLTFGGGNPATLKVELFFDTYADATPGSPPKDVRKEYTDKIWKLMAVDYDRLKDPSSKKARPPRVRFHWGTTWNFIAVIESISQKFTLFYHDGTPLRATLNVSFKQEVDQGDLQPSTNPTSGGVGGEKFWTVEVGDTLGYIAYKEYGQTSLWRVIADANGLEEVRELQPGTVLLIPNA
jgi:nucleoid-associated protein YgaU